MARADFTWIRFNHHFDPADPVSEATQHRTFTIEGNPVGPGYLLVQAHDVEAGNHEIEINGQELPALGLAPDLAPAANERWTAWMEQIPGNILQPGDNRITIRRIGPDGFRVAGVVVHWREPG